MADQYLLPCDCGHQTQVDTTQAGQTLKCAACQAELSVPAYSRIKKLQPAKTDDAESGDRKSGGKQERSMLKSSVFTGGLIVTLLGLIAAAVFFYLFGLFYQEPPTSPLENIAAVRSNFIDPMSPLETLELWDKQIVKEGLPDEWQPDRYLGMKMLFTNYRRFGILSAIIAGAGVLLMLASMFIRR
jgi:hypothetical protein